MSDPFEVKIWEGIAERLRQLTEEAHSEALYGPLATRLTTSSTPAKELTLETLEAAVRDIDPDGRHLQEGRLLAACAKLPKEHVETVIRMAEYMAKEPWLPSWLCPICRRHGYPSNTPNTGCTTCANAGRTLDGVRPADKEEV